jgi:hypothetical protein
VTDELLPEEWIFEWNSQKAIVSCICGKTDVDVHSTDPAMCPECGRVYQIHATITVDWGELNRIDEELED